jgi:hypothetical protein
MEVSTKTKKQTMLPAFVGDLVESVNCSARVLRKTCEGLERVVDGIDEIATVSMKLKKAQLLETYKAVG